MSVSYIGQWVRRRGQRAHLVESEITDRLVMRCGRQMKLRTRSGDLVLYAGNLLCHQCVGREP